MNSKMKKRMGVVAGVIVIVVILLLAFLGGGNSAKVATVADVAKGGFTDAKVQVTGKVVDNSYSVGTDGTLTFKIADEDDAAQAATLTVNYDKGMSATFGNGVTAICTGRISTDGSMTCSELVTKCPSKYENATEALAVSQLLGYDDGVMVGKTVKVTGDVSELADATAKVRFRMWDTGMTCPTGESSLPIVFAGSLSDEVADGSSVVVTGALQDDGSFLATEVSIAK